MSVSFLIYVDQGWDSPRLKSYFLSLWLRLFQCKTPLWEQTGIVELGESQPIRLMDTLLLHQEYVPWRDRWFLFLRESQPRSLCPTHCGVKWLQASLWSECSCQRCTLLPEGWRSENLEMYKTMDQLSIWVIFMNTKHRHLKCQIMVFKCQKWRNFFYKVS